MMVSRRYFGLGLSALAMHRLRLSRALQPERTTTPRLELSLRDYATMPMTGAVDGKGEVQNVYRGKAIAALRGKYLFGDVSTGKLWWADFEEMIAADDSDAKTLAAMHPVAVRWSQPGGTSAVYPSLAPIAEWAYHARGGKAAHLPGIAIIAAQGRADIHLWEDGEGTLYILSKSDGMIRVVTNAAMVAV